MPDIFVSHASKDDALVDTLLKDALKLIASEHRPSFWVDHVDGIGTSKNWQRELDKGLSECPRFLLFVSCHSMESDEVMAEWRAAIFFKHPILPVIIDDVPENQISSRLRLIQAINLHKNKTTGLATLAKAITGERGEDIPEFRRPTITGMIRREHILIPLHGRENDVEKIIALLRQAHTPVFIVGVGGLGKSRLAAEIALTTSDAVGIIWHTLSDITQPYEITDLLRQHFKLEANIEESEVFARLHADKCLIVLDNAEDVPPEDSRCQGYVSLVENLLAHEAQVLITSRVEWKALKLAKRHEPSALDLTSAADIVMDMAMAFEVEGIEPYAEDIARAARLHPRLIEWALMQMRELPRADVINDLQTLESADAQAALNEMIGKTLARMRTTSGGIAAERALRQLLVCRGGFTYEAAEAITELTGNELKAALKTLQTWRFITFYTAKQRYDIPPMVTLAVGASADVRQHHYEYYYTLAKQHDKMQDYLGLDIESDNLTAAFEGAMAANQTEDAFWLAHSCLDFLGNRGRFDQRLEWFLALETALKNHYDKELLAALGISIGNTFSQHPIGNRLDNLRRAKAAYIETLRFCPPDRASHGYAVTQTNLGITYSELAKYETPLDNLRRAEAAYHEALRFRTLDHAQQGYVITQANLGNLYINLADHESPLDNLHRAEAAFLEALRYYTPERSPQHYANAQNNLGNLYTILADHETRLDNLRRAEAAHLEALRYRTVDSAPQSYAMTQNNLGSLYIVWAAYETPLDNLRRAEAAFLEVLRFYTPERSPQSYAMTQNNLGEMFRIRAEHEHPIENLRLGQIAFQEALQFLASKTTPLDYAVNQYEYGRLHREWSRHENETVHLRAARGCWREAELIYRELEMPDKVNELRKCIEEAEERLSDLDE